MYIPDTLYNYSLIIMFNYTCTCTCTCSFIQRLGIALHKYDEMETLVRGVQYFCRHLPNECYYWENPKEPDLARKKIFKFDPGIHPFIIVNIGSGVSILHVTGHSQFKRIGGTCIYLLYLYMYMYIVYCIVGIVVGIFCWENQEMKRYVHG